MPTRDKRRKAKQKRASAGIGKLMREWQSKGTMSTSRATYHPKSKKTAAAQAAAIEYGREGLGRASKKKKKKKGK